MTVRNGRITGLFFLLMTASAFAGSTGQSAARSTYFNIMIGLFVLLIILFIWELADWRYRRKIQGESTSGTINVVEEQSQDDDPFKALLKEDSLATAKMHVAAQEQETEPERPLERGKMTQELAAADSPPMIEPAEDKRSRRKIQIAMGDEPEGESPVKMDRKSLDAGAIDAQGWTDLMYRATEEGQEMARKPAEDHQERKIIEEVKPVRPVKIIQPAMAPPPPAADDDEDPWKALLKKSKQEEKREEEKPWSVYLKGDKTAPQGEISAPPAADIPVKKSVQPSLQESPLTSANSSMAEPPRQQERAEPAESTVTNREAGKSDDKEEKACEAPEKDRDEEPSKAEDVAAIEFKETKKKEDDGGEKKFTTPVSVKKAIRVISIPSASDKAEEKPEIKTETKEDSERIKSDKGPRRVIRLDDPGK